MLLGANKHAQKVLICISLPSYSLVASHSYSSLGFSPVVGAVNGWVLFRFSSSLYEYEYASHACKQFMWSCRVYSYNYCFFCSKIQTVGEKVGASDRGGRGNDGWRDDAVSRRCGERWLPERPAGGHRESSLIKYKRRIHVVIVLIYILKIGGKKDPCRIWLLLIYIL